MNVNFALKILKPDRPQWREQEEPIFFFFFWNEHVGAYPQPIRLEYSLIYNISVD